MNEEYIFFLFVVGTVAIGLIMNYLDKRQGKK